MKYRVKDYAKALVEVLDDKELNQEQVAEGFAKLLERQGDLGKAKEILVAAKMLMAKKNGKKSVVFEMARKLTAGQKEMLAKFVEEGDIVEEKINKDLIAGIKIIVDNEKQLDNSMQNKINKLF